MTTPLIIPPLSDSEKLEFGENSNHLPPVANDNKLVVASYNIRYARGPFLISGGLRRKMGLMSMAGRPQHVGRMISAAARAFTGGRLLPRPDIIALQEADKGTARTGGHHVAKELAEQMGMHWVHAPAGIPRGVAPAKRQWWLDFEEPIDLHDSGDTGVALLSRLPLNDVTRIDLPWQECPWRPRMAIAATITTSNHQVRILNAHVDPHAAPRRWKIKRLTEPRATVVQLNRGSSKVSRSQPLHFGAEVIRRAELMTDVKTVG